uniref:peptidoglycan recognition protein family protein n=1 Tax=Herbidospora sakaeratensis TaxID=564415 RepID=UPI000784259D|nr:N-acetylmuramoyl-L-alanine amidase [Herbidospora sakaeratensis]
MVQVQLITRAGWGARAPKQDVPALYSTKGVKVHYTGGRVDPAIVSNHNICVGLVRGYQRMHMDDNGWSDLGYTAAACPHRKVFVGRGPNRLPAANGAGRNSGHYAVLGLVGNAGFVRPNDGLLHGIVDAIEYLRAEGRAGREVKGHRDGYSTSCPGDALYAWVQRGAPRPGGAPPKAPVEELPVVNGIPTWLRPIRLQTPMLAGLDVREWQEKARQWVASLVADGIYGKQSQTACRALQKLFGLPVTGVVDEETWTVTFALES